ncbi:family 47 glycoside hydrolase [Xylariaceae sp. FL1019]|nr:family 47 glycoside hydrolase [Xylariaceae sp. FL1019]
MVAIRRRVLLPFAIAIVLTLTYYTSWTDHWRSRNEPHHPVESFDDPEYFWRKIPTRYPAQSIRPLPTGRPLSLPLIQHQFPSKEKDEVKRVRLQRQASVKQAFSRCWNAYRDHSWLQDELAPISGGSKNTFGGWAATLVDSLDTLWIMGMHDEFERAVAASTNISFEKSSLEQVNAFETTIRYLGGFLGAYDLSGDARLLQKARQVGEMLYVAFDTPNRMPITRWDFNSAAQGGKQEASKWALVAEIGSLCMEFTRLSLLTGDSKWFDATERITEVLHAQQSMTKLPGMWPISVNPKDLRFYDDNAFGLGAMSDSTFEYLPKMTALTGGLLPNYEEMYSYAMDTAKAHNLYRPMTPENADILISATVHVETKGNDEVPVLDLGGQHLVCFVGGMLAIGAKLYRRPVDMVTARQITDGCIYTYQAMPHGIMPETFSMSPCPSTSDSSPPTASACPWNETLWKQALLARAEVDITGLDEEAVEKHANRIIAEKRLPKGFTSIPDTRYILRPEAIESVFVMYRVSGDPAYLEHGWSMFEAIQSATQTELANAALADVTVGKGQKPPQMDSMESFWLGETLKYFYLLFSEPGLVSLDEFVFNTEAHPLRRLVR